MPLAQDGPDTMFWAEGEQRFELHRVVRRHFHPVTLRDRRQDTLRLHQREVVPDAPARPAPKGEVGEAGPSLRQLRRKSVRIELFRTFSEVRMPVRGVWG